MRYALVLPMMATALTMACAKPAAAPCPKEKLEIVGTEALCPIIYPRPRAEVESEMSEFGMLAGQSDSPSDPVHWFRVVEDCFELACGIEPGPKLRAAEAKCFLGCRQVTGFSTRAVPRGCPARVRPDQQS